MAFGNLGRSLTALEIFDLVRDDLNQVEREIGLESVASVEAVTYIGQYLQIRRRKTSAADSGFTVREAVFAKTARGWCAWRRWWR